jgi:hypothetical protein
MTSSLLAPPLARLRNYTHSFFQLEYEHISSICLSLRLVL